MSEICGFCGREREDHDSDLYCPRLTLEFEAERPFRCDRCDGVVRFLYALSLRTDDDCERMIEVMMHGASVETATRICIGCAVEEFILENGGAKLGVQCYPRLPMRAHGQDLTALHAWAPPRSWLREWRLQPGGPRSWPMWGKP